MIRVFVFWLKEWILEKTGGENESASALGTRGKAEQGPTASHSSAAALLAADNTDLREALPLSLSSVARHSLIHSWH